MIGDILNAILQETVALSRTWENYGTVLLKTDYKNTKLVDYAMPLVIVDLADGVDSKQYPGGLTRMEWQYAFNSYNYSPDGYVDDTTGYSTSLLKIPIDEIRRHFEIGKWIAEDPNAPGTYLMNIILDLYGFRFTFSGVTPADHLDEDGLVMGYKIGFDSVSFDNVTKAVVYSDEVLEVVEQVDNPPFDETTGIPIINNDTLDIELRAITFGT